MLPKICLIRQTNPAGVPIGDIASSVEETVAALSLPEQKLNGKKIGIAVGSRGINRLPEIVRAVVAYVTRAGGTPVVFAAMGSHGGGTEEGQTEMLHSLGITEQNVGAPVRCCAKTELLGSTQSGYPVYYNPIVDSFDSLILINRVKTHTDFSDVTESGLLKLCAIGIGNPAGCQTVHNLAVRHGYGPVIRETAALMLSKFPVIFGLMLTENWKSELDSVEAVLPGDFVRRETEVLTKVKASQVKLPVKELDTLIVGEIGKNISGSGMDCKVIGRIMIRGQKEPDYPKISRVIVLDITEASHGNAIGIGLADLTTRRVLDKVDFPSTSLNSVSSMSPEQGRMPCVMRDDREAIEWGVATSGPEDPEKIKLIYIRNTNLLETVAVSESVYEHLKSDKNIQLLRAPEEMRFDSEGRLLNFRAELFA